MPIGEELVRREEEALKVLRQKVEADALALTNTALRQDPGWLAEFDERQRRLIANCQVYASHDPAGLQGHNIMLIVDKMASLLDSYYYGAREGEKMTEHPGA